MTDAPNTKWRHTTLATGPHDWRRAWHRGWVDAQNSPDRWPADYERMNRSEQIAYEQARLHLRNVVAAGLPVPRWDGSKATCDAVAEADAKASALIGDPVPHFDRMVA